MTLGDTTTRDIALQSLDFLLATAVQPDGHVWHAAAEATSYIAGLLADYVGLADALLDAFQVRGRPQDVQMAERIMERAVQLFWDQERGGFYDRPADPAAPALLANREKAFADTPLPGDNAVAARALNTPYLLTSQERWRELATKTLAAFAGAAREQGTFVGTYGLALEAHLHKPPQVVIMGPRQDQWASFRISTFPPPRFPKKRGNCVSTTGRPRTTIWRRLWPTNNSGRKSGFSPRIRCPPRGKGLVKAMSSSTPRM